MKTKPKRQRWSKQDEEALFYEYFYGGDKGDVPMHLIAKSLGRTESACRSKLYRMCARTASNGGEDNRCACGEKLRGHEDENATQCRWCVTGWTACDEAGNEAAVKGGSHE